MDVKNAAVALVDNITLLTDYNDKIHHITEQLTVAYNAGHDDATIFASKFRNNVDSADLWATETDHKVTAFNEPVQFAIRYYHKTDSALREVLCSTEHAVLAELHVLLLKDDATGVSVVRVNRG